MNNSVQDGHVGGCSVSAAARLAVPAQSPCAPHCRQAPLPLPSRQAKGGEATVEGKALAVEEEARKLDTDVTLLRTRVLQLEGTLRARDKEVERLRGQVGSSCWRGTEGACWSGQRQVWVRLVDQSEQVACHVDSADSFQKERCFCVVNAAGGGSRRRGSGAREAGGGGGQVGGRTVMSSCSLGA